MIDPQEGLKAIEENGSQKPEEVETDLPAETTIEMDAKGLRNKSYRIRCRYRVPNLGDQIKIGQLKSLYKLGAGTDANAELLVEQIAYLQVTIGFPDGYEKPPWFTKMLDLYDATPISELYRRCTAYEARFHGTDSDEGPDQEADSGSGTSSRSGEANVGEEVQPSTERRETLVSHDS